MSLRRSRVALSGVIAAALVFGVAGCGSGAKASGGGAGELTIWSQWVQGQPGQKFMQGVIDDFQHQTGVKVTVQWKGNPVASSLLPTLNTSNVPTDIVETSDGQIESTLYPAGGMLSLADVYKDKVPGTDKTIADIEGKQVATLATPISATGGSQGDPVLVPYWMSGTGVFFFNGKQNPALVGNPPKDWATFSKILGELKAKGRQPLAVDGSVQSYNSWYLQNLIRSIVGDNGTVGAEIDKTGQTWKKPGYLQAAQLVEQMVKDNYFVKGYDGSKFPAIENKWANNESDFSLNGTWLAQEVAPVAADGFDYQTFRFPAVAGHKAPAIDTGVSGIGILKKAKNLDNAKKFAAFILQPKYQTLVSTQMMQIPISRDVAAPAPVKSIKAAIDAGNILTYRRPAAALDYETKVLFPLDDQLIFGKITGQQFIDQIVTKSAAYWTSKS